MQLTKMKREREQPKLHAPRARSKHATKGYNEVEIGDRIHRCPKQALPLRLSDKHTLRERRRSRERAGKAYDAAGWEGESVCAEKKERGGTVARQSQYPPVFLVPEPRIFCRTRSAEHTHPPCTGAYDKRRRCRLAAPGELVVRPRSTIG